MGFSFSGAISGAVSGFMVGGFYGAAAGAVVGGVSGGKQEKAAKNAAAAAAASAKRTGDLSKKYNEPYAVAGKNALQRMQQLLGLPTDGQDPDAPKPGTMGAPTDIESEQSWIKRRQDALVASGQFSGEDGITDAAYAARREADGYRANGGVMPWQRPGELVKARPQSQTFSGNSGEIAKLFESTPGYQFTRDQSEEAIRREAARTGRAYDPSMLMALQSNSAGLASTTFDNYMDRLTNLSEMGRGAGNNIVGTLSDADRYATQASIAQQLGTSAQQQSTMGTIMGAIGTYAGGATAGTGAATTTTAAPSRPTTVMV